MHLIKSAAEIKAALFIFLGMLFLKVVIIISEEDIRLF